MLQRAAAQWPRLSPEHVGGGRGGRREALDGQDRRIAPLSTPESHPDHPESAKRHPQVPRDMVSEGGSLICGEGWGAPGGLPVPDLSLSYLPQPIAALLKMYVMRVSALAIEVAVEYWIAMNGSTQVRANQGSLSRVLNILSS